jgi:hypothetical protein
MYDQSISEHAVAELAEDSASEGDEGESIEEVADHLYDEGDKHEGLQAFGEEEGEEEGGDEGAHVEQAEHPPGFLGHILELRLGAGEEAGAGWGRGYPAMLSICPKE